LIRAVTFDVGGTLIEPWPSVGEIYSRAAAQAGAGVLDPAIIGRQFSAAWKRRINFAYSRQEWARLIEECFSGLIPPGQAASFFPELYDQFGRAECWRIFDDAVPALDDLARAGVRLGIISNWDERLRPLLACTGLNRFFETIVISCEAGCCKPAPAIFGQAAARLGFPPNEILHVGDTPSTDVAGARNAGFAAVELRRGADASDPGVINSLRMLISTINKTE
jgi:putative hydrolase of the HAD superfamily